MVVKGSDYIIVCVIVSLNLDDGIIWYPLQATDLINSLGCWPPMLEPDGLDIRKRLRKFLTRVT